MNVPVKISRKFQLNETRGIRIKSALPYGKMDVVSPREPVDCSKT